MDKFAARVGRQYHLFDYVGAPDAENIVILMGSGAEAVEEIVEHLNSKGEKVGMIKVRLFRPFSTAAFINELKNLVQLVNLYTSMSVRLSVKGWLRKPCN